MTTLYKYSDTINKAFECIRCNTETSLFPVKLHWHYFGEMILLIKGRLVLQIDTQWYNMEKGDFIFICPETVHGIFSADEETAEFIVIKYDPEKLPESTNKITVSNAISYAKKNNIKIHFNAEIINKYNIHNIFFECLDEFNNKNWGYESIIKSNVHKILILLIRLWKNADDFINDNMANENTEYELQGITEYIDKHANEHITVTDIAKLCGISYSNFAKKFRELYGMSCKEYIDKIRIMKIENLLACTNYDLNYISQETGYADCSHMIRAFKKAHNMTPKEFRNEARKKLHKPNH